MYCEQTAQALLHFSTYVAAYNRSFIPFPHVYMKINKKGTVPSSPLSLVYISHMLLPCLLCQQNDLHSTAVWSTPQLTFKTSDVMLTLKGKC